MFSLRDAFVTAGFPETNFPEPIIVKRTMTNALTPGTLASPTARACYEAELYNGGKAFYKRHLRNVGAVQVSYPSRYKLKAAREFEDQLQRTRQAERDIIKESYLALRKVKVSVVKPNATWEQVFG